MITTPALLSEILVALAIAAPSELTLERIYSDPPLAGHSPPALELSPDGQALALLRPNADDSEVLDLWVQRLPDGALRRVIATQDLLASGGQKLTEAERMALERKRIYQTGITSFAWCTATSTALLIPFSGDLYLVGLAGDGPAEVVRLTRDDSVPELAPQCSPRGSYVSYTKHNDMFVLSMADRRERRLTHEGTKTKSFGLAEFIAAEEMGRHRGHWWSPDERRLLVFEVDEAPVAVKVRTRIFVERTETYQQRYPVAGADNARVKAHVFDVASGKRTTLETPREDGYLPRAGFFGDSTAWLQWQSRDQRRLVVLGEAPSPGRLSPILEETDDAWLVLHHDMRPLKDGRFLWSSERTGRRQLEIVDRTSKERTTLTAEQEPVVALAGVDEARGIVYYRAHRKRGREVHLFAIPLSGGSATAIAAEPGWHEVEFSRSGTRFIDVHSQWGRPPTVSLGEPGGARQVLDANPTPELDALSKPTAEWRDFEAADKTPLNGVLLPPIGAVPGKRYPVLMWVYGGPTHGMVTNRWGKLYPLFVYLTQQGYGVALVDNRGTGGRGRAIDRAHHRAIGEVEPDDIFRAVGQLGAVPWVDPARIGIWGWSYGGYVAARAVLDAKSPFAAAVAVAPVTDWTLYDTHYTERYLGQPGDGTAKPYLQSNLVARAHLLEQPLMILHGTADDNVLFEHSLRLIAALQAANRRFDLMIYPGKAHGISGRAARLHLFSSSIAFFDRHLGVAR